MRTMALSWRYLAARPLAAALNLLLLTLGLASITFVVVVGGQVTRSFQRDLAGIDLVVGAKGSPLQLILAGVFHIDVPPGNIALADVRALASRPEVAQLIPLSLGDSFRGFRIVGTTPDYARHYRVQLAAGRDWQQPMEAVAGPQVARATGLQVGAAFHGTHGLGAGGHTHGDTPYRVVGVLAPCGCVLDRLILTATESVWQVHETSIATDDADRRALEEAREVTLALVRYKSPLAAASFPRYVNNETDMQAAAPAIEITRLLRMLGVGTEVLRGVGAVLLLTAALSVFIALWTAVRERRADLAMLRMLGASPGQVAVLVLCEAFWLAAIASVLGLFTGHALAAATGAVLAARQSLPIEGWQWVAAEAWIPVAAAVTAAVAACIPAVTAYRVDVAQLLSSR
jgi:putative ABC transport system permease protein